MQSALVGLAVSLAVAIFLWIFARKKGQSRIVAFGAAFGGFLAVPVVFTLIVAPETFKRPSAAAPSSALQTTDQAPSATGSASDASWYTVQIIPKILDNGQLGKQAVCNVFDGGPGQAIEAFTRGGIAHEVRDTTEGGQVVEVKITTADGVSHFIRGSDRCYRHKAKLDGGFAADEKKLQTDLSKYK